MDFYTGLRNQLIEYLIREKGITDPLVIKAMATIERHTFIQSAFAHQAYNDTALKIGCEQTISQPSTVALQSQLLEINANERVLEIGTGSGYQAAVLSPMGARVYTIERHYELYQKTSQFLKTIARNIFAFYGDGFVGLPQHAPFDKILITCGAPEIPFSLFQQLKIGGIMVIPIERGQGEQEMYKIIKRDVVNYDSHSFGVCKFVPMLKDKAQK